MRGDLHWDRRVAESGEFGLQKLVPSNQQQAKRDQPDDQVLQT